MNVYPKFSHSPRGQRMASSIAFCSKCHSISFFWVRQVSFAAITLCIALQHLFIVVFDKCSLQFYNGLYEGTTYLHDAWLQTWETGLESAWKIETVFTDNAIGSTQTFEWFFLVLTLQNYWWRPMDFHFWDCWQVSPPLWSKPTNFKGGIWMCNGMDFCEVSASLLHWQVRL